jgi:hypothetical protein
VVNWCLTYEHVGIDRLPLKKNSETRSGERASN